MKKLMAGTALLTTLLFNIQAQASLTLNLMAGAFIADAVGTQFVIASGTAGTLGGVLAATSEAEEEKRRVGIILMIIGALILDSEGSDVSFDEVTDSVAKKIGMSQPEMDAFNANSEELAVIFDELKAEINENTSKQDVRNLVEEAMVEFDRDAVNGMVKSIRASIQEFIK